MELNTIQQQTNWQNASNNLNANFSKVNIEVEKLKNVSVKVKGVFQYIRFTSNCIPLTKNRGYSFLFKRNSLDNNPIPATGPFEVSEGLVKLSSSRLDVFMGVNVRIVTESEVNNRMIVFSESIYDVSSGTDVIKEVRFTRIDENGSECGITIYDNGVESSSKRMGFDFNNMYRDGVPMFPARA